MSRKNARVKKPRSKTLEDREGLLETFEIKQDKKLMRAIQRGKRFFRSGRKGTPHTEIDWD